MLRRAPLLLVLALGACVPEATQRMYDQTSRAKPVELNDSPRVQVSRIGVFEDNLAYDSRRGVYLIKDTETGKEFIGISGVGITEVGSHKSGKTTMADER